jgi:hypothetical protein
VPSPTHAADFTTNYKVEYFPDVNNGTPLTKVKMKIDLISHSAGSYISKFSISFPKVFKIDNATALFNVPITPQTETTGEVTTLQVTLPEPTSSDKSVSTVYFDFYQENLFKINGNVWEFILPTILMEKENNYEISLHMPENSDKKLSISKPKPSTVDGNTITWRNPDVKTIFTTFGSKQLYAINLSYHLKNPELRRVYTDVAFPPDSLYQKIYLEQIDPEPSQMFRDEDGNMIGRYYLDPRENKEITYKGTIEVLSLPRSEVKSYQATKLSEQEGYLLQKNKFWSVDVKTDFTTAEDIFSYVTSALQYDHAGADSKRQRMGANEALRQPSKAVCTEYTDVFVALARQKGIYAREVEGYGYSFDSQLRPVSTKSDILHAWPEYFDAKTAQWTPVDPTWQSTSGINYFSSLDLNHIVFAIHGKDPEYPLPAGTYKLEDSKDVSVEPIAMEPREKRDLSVTSINIPSKLFGNKLYSQHMVVENKGNTYLWNVPVQIQTNFGLHKTIYLDSLAPLETRSVPLLFKTPNVLNLQAAFLTATALNQTLYTDSFQLMPYYYDLALKTGIIITVLASGLLLIKVFFLKRRSAV